MTLVVYIIIMVLTNKTGSITVTVSLKADESLNGTIMTCTDQSDSTFTETQLVIRGN